MSAQIELSCNFISPTRAEWCVCIHKNGVAVRSQRIVKPCGKLSFLSFSTGIHNENFSWLHISINLAAAESPNVSDDCSE